MPDKEKNVVLNFKMDGQVQYADTLKDINRVMNIAAKEYKNHIAAMGRDASATDKLRAEKKKLEIQMEGAQKRTQMLRDEYEEMAKDTNTSTAELEKMYSKLLDSERAEIALQKSLDRVNGGLSEQAQEAREAQGTLEDLKDENKLLEAEQKSLNSAFKLQNAELGNNADEAEKLELAQRQLAQQMELSERVVRNLESQLEAAKKVYGENSIEVMQMETKLNDARTTISKFNKSLDSIEDSSNNARDGLEELGKKVDLNNLIEAAELLQGVSDKLFEVGQAAFDNAMEFGNSQSDIRANLGLTEDEAEKLNDVVDQVFRNGIVGSIEEATDAVIITKQTFEDLNNVQLEKVTNKVTAIAKRTGTDVKENIRGAEQLMTAFGLTGEQALDLISAGYQNNLNRSDDFTDSLIEYAPLFQQAGFSADEMLQVMQNGLENGARNTDLVADAVKELQIRMGDGTFEESLENFSDKTEATFEKWKDGEATVADVAVSIQKDLEKMSPAEQQEALSAISTQFEDLGINASANLFMIGEEFDNVNGKADEMAQKSPGEEWESSLRELSQSLLPVGQNIVDGLSPVVDILADMGKWFSELPEPLQNFIIIFGTLVAIAGVATPIIFGLAAALTALQIPLLPIIAIIAGVAAAIAGIIILIQNWGDITDWIGEKWDQFTSWLKEKVEELAIKFVQGFTDMKDGAVNKYNELKDKAYSTIANFVSNSVNKVNELKAKFVNKVKDLRDGAVDRFNNLRDKAGDVMEAAQDKILTPIENARDKIGDIVENIKDFFSGMKLKIPTPSLPKLPHFSLEWGSRTFFGKEISYPTGFDVDWRAKGGIFTQPTIFGMSNGRLQGAGEAGPEAVLPLNEETLGAIGEGIGKTMRGTNGEVVVHVYLDTDEVNTKLAPGMSQKIHQSNKFGARRIAVIQP